MAECIERENLPQEVSADGMSDTVVAFAAGYNTCLEHVKSIPAADVRPVVRGKWEYNGPDENVPYCSNCMLPSDEETRFCAGCGADMREESHADTAN